MRHLGGLVVRVVWVVSVAVLTGWLVAAIHRGSGVGIFFVAIALAALTLGPLLRPRKPTR